MSEGHDFGRLIQSQRLTSYERYEARNSYAYAVDLRRAEWAATSRLGSPLTRVLDRAWVGFAETLKREAYTSPPEDVPTKLLAELYGIVQRLRAPSPTVLQLGEAAKRSPLTPWPIATPVGTCSGNEHWLLLDVQTLLELEPGHRRFVLGSALGHLHCGHGPYFACHAMLHSGGRRRLIEPVRWAMSPWSRVLGYSADRAGALACESLEATQTAIVADDELRAQIHWLPKPPPLETRLAAALDFSRSVTHARTLALYRRLGLDSAIDSEHAGPSPEPQPDSETGERTQAETATDSSASLGGVETTRTGAWSLARCDRRLTERLGLF